VPQENIERAIKRAKEAASLEELIIEAYGPGGCALLIEAISDNKNRTLAEIKKILNDFNAKIATPGSVLWAFEKTPDGWQIKFSQPLQPEDLEKAKQLIEELEEQDDVQKVYSNANL
jgi:transcriptional/translational regulatory protein YebC/TACO1